MMNYNFVVNLLDFFKINGSFKTAKISLLLTAIVGFISYDLLIVYRVADPDTIIEGLTYYINATWAIVGCGRWLLPIVNILSGNIIMPPFVVAFYCFVMWLCAIIICRIWKIEKTFHVLVITICLSVTPAAVSQLVATYMGVCFALACLFATVFVYFCFESDSRFSFFLCVCSIVASLALYQSYIAHAATLTLMTLALYLYQNREQKLIINKAVKAFIAALAGMICYFISNKVILALLHLESSSRLAEFSITRIFSDLGSTLFGLYKTYFSFLNDATLLRRYLYLFLFVTIVISTVLYLLKKEVNIVYKVLFVLCLILIPFATNVIGLITPDNPITVLMTYQYILIVPFAFALINKQIRISEYTVIVLSVILCWTHVVSANATFECYRMSHDYVYNQYSQVIYDVQHTEGYVKDETPVLIAGFFDDSTLRKNIRTYDYSFELFDDLVFWDTLGGATYNRHRYVMQYFGLDFIDFSIEEYQRIISTDEFKKMNLWPDKEGMKFIDGYLVVKINDNVAK